MCPGKPLLDPVAYVLGTSLYTSAELRAGRLAVRPYRTMTVHQPAHHEIDECHRLVPISGTSGTRAAQARKGGLTDMSLCTDSLCVSVLVA